MIFYLLYGMFFAGGFVIGWWIRGSHMVQNWLEGGMIY